MSGYTTLMKALLASLERTTVTIPGFLAAFTGIILVRCFIEAFSSATSSGFPPVDFHTILHYGLFYLLTYLVLALVIGFFTREYVKTSKVLLFGFLAIWVGPLLDLILSGPLASVVTYLFHTPGMLVVDFLTFFGPLSRMGATLGIRIEVFTALLVIAWYVRESTGQWKRAVGAWITSYAAIFILFALPSFLYALAGTAPEGIVAFFAAAVEGSNLAANALPGTIIPASPTLALELGFNKLFSLVFVLLIALVGAALAYRLVPHVVIAHLKNVRLLRTLFYLLLVSMGVVVAQVSLSWPDILGLLTLLVAWFSAWMFSVCVNDVVDIDIDTVSNTERPLVNGTLNERDMRDASLLFLVLALIGGASVGYYPFFFLLIFITAFYIYSAPPLRLKRVPLLSSFLIGIAASASVLAGFSFASPDTSMPLYPLGLVMGICISITLAANLRDLKDLAGDEAAGITTFALVLRRKYGERAAFHIVGVLVAAAFVLSALFLRAPFFPYLAIIAAVGAYILITRVPYNERPVFLVVLACLVVAGLLLLVA